jgi:transcriptional regulator with XRE-family HTH domain
MPKTPLLTPEAPMSAKDKAYYTQLGRRNAQLRRAASNTQVELAQTLGVAQRIKARYRGGVSRIAVALLPRVAEALGRASTVLPKAPQRLVMGMPDGVLQQPTRQGRPP